MKVELESNHIDFHLCLLSNFTSQKKEYLTCERSMIISHWWYSSSLTALRWAEVSPGHHQLPYTTIHLTHLYKSTSKKKPRIDSPPHPCLLAVSSMYTWCQSKQDSTLAPSVQTWTPSLNLRLQPLKERIGCREDGCPSYEVFEKEPQSHILLSRSW